MGWTRRANPKWHHRHGQTWQKGDVNFTVTYDRHGNAKINTWDSIWPTSCCGTRWAKRLTNRQFRQAHKLQIAYELEMHHECLADEDWHTIEEVYEDWLNELDSDIDWDDVPNVYEEYWLDGPYGDEGHIGLHFDKEIYDPFEYYGDY